MAGNITKRGKNTWRIRINFGTDANGKRRNFNQTIHGSKKDADTFLTAKLREKDLGTFVQMSPKTLDEFLDKWLAESARPRLALATFEQYTYLLRLYVRDTLGGRRISNIKPGDIQELYSAMLDRGRSPRTVRYVHAILTSAFSQAIKWHMLSINPCMHACILCVTCCQSHGTTEARPLFCLTRIADVRVGIGHRQRPCRRPVPVRWRTRPVGYRRTARSLAACG